MEENRARAERLAEERREARAAKDFARADRLRDEIAGLGFDVTDTAEGSRLTPRGPLVTAHVLYEGHRSDLERFLGGLPRRDDAEVIVTDNASPDGEWLESLADETTQVLHLAHATGWAESRNAAARASRGEILVFADLSVEPLGDIVGPLVETLRGDPGVGLCGPWGLVTRDLRSFEESPGPDVDAIEGYLLAVRREQFLQDPFDPWFKWYRHADLDLSFRIRSQGLAARVVPVPAVRHAHRGWEAVPEPERSARSKRNFYRFLDHWRDRTDLLVTRSQA